MNARKEQLPSKDELLHALATTTPAVQAEFRDALDALEEAVRTGVRLSEWHTPTDPLGFPFVSYNDCLWDSLQTARALIQATGYQGFWIEHLPETPKATASLSIVETAAFLDRIHHEERICDGTIQACVENGTLLAALQALRTAIRAT